MNIRARIVAAAASASMCLLCAAAHAESVRTPVPDARPVMLAALQSADGTAHGVLAGEIADAITKRFEATSPIYIDVSTERRYREPGCSRLKVLFWQEGVRLPEAKAPRKQTIEFGINYCATGLPPKSLL
ncbi:hypothetical protein [Hydrogenophaga pseudoflava]|uniref:Uncharacterized protein n=1 Tax=Hydrogenophaga pseudoflava TaxID=47421 RepID=A0A4P6X407_HYDPS|nr:hypothetical protein [Hydrogenophaga pseudoflava]MCM2337145.1 hypothetical protein [Lysobacter sp.]QBM28531.1 hypothetical protein HPF_12595 [Hydrogenophaga pseudoflava]